MGRRINYLVENLTNGITNFFKHKIIASMLQYHVYFHSSSFDIKVPSGTSCGQLLEVVRRRYEEEFERPGSHVLGLKSLGGHEVLDSWLSKPNRPIPALSSSQNSLAAIIEENPGDTKMKNLKFDDFEFEKCIGKGGTSEVYLGLF